MDGDGAGARECVCARVCATSARTLAEARGSLARAFHDAEKKAPKCEKHCQKNGAEGPSRRARATAQSPPRTCLTQYPRDSTEARRETRWPPYVVGTPLRRGTSRGMFTRRRRPLWGHSAEDFSTLAPRGSSPLDAQRASGALGQMFSACNRLIEGSRNYCNHNNTSNNHNDNSSTSPRSAFFFLSIHRCI